MSSSLRCICRPHAMLTSLISCRHQVNLSIVRLSLRNPSYKPRLSGFQDLNRTQSWFRVNLRKTVVSASSWADQNPTMRLSLERDADDEQIKSAYRRLAKFYHPDAYDGRGTLEEGETAEARFIKIQAAYELLVDEERHRKYDTENRVNPMKFPRHLKHGGSGL